jgi:dihydrodipicolinate synthase/N-acetylneuraminate lyase
MAYLTGVSTGNARGRYYRGIANQKIDRSLDAEKHWKRGAKLGHAKVRYQHPYNNHHMFCMGVVGFMSGIAACSSKARELLSAMKSKRAQEARQQADKLLQVTLWPL